MAQSVSDCLKIMRLALGKRNKNDPDTSDTVFLQYLNDFMQLTMSDDFKLFELFGTLQFPIDSSVVDGVYTFNDVGATDDFTNISQEGFISLTDPETESLSWNRLNITQDPSSFYGKWGVNNYSILTPGYPEDMLYYGNEMVFRTIPDKSYKVYIFGYKILPRLSEEDDDGEAINLPHDYYIRYIAYGSALNFARDYRFSAEDTSRLESIFAKERVTLMKRTHNQIKTSRALPRF
jgi:hypothetical protein